MLPGEDSLTARIDRLHSHGLVDMHFDFPMDLYEKRRRARVLETEYLPELRAGDVGVVAAPLYVLDIYLPELGLRVALDQVARLYVELEQTDQFALCRTYAEILLAREAGKIALLLAMEGVEPIGEDIDLLRVFHELGLRVLSLTHARRNWAAEGGVFAAGGSSSGGLTRLGREVVRQCEALGIIVDLAHINPAGFDDVLAMTARPVIVSHTNARRYYDIERNIGDDQIRMIGRRGGVIGVNSIFVSTSPAEANLDRYIDHLEHIAGLAGIECVGLGLDFFEAISSILPMPAQDGFGAGIGDINLVPGLTRHSHLRSLTRRLIERGFADEDIEKILYGNWMRLLRRLL